MTMRINQRMLVFVGFVLWLTGCTTHPNHEYIQGGWIFVDPHLQDVVGQSYLEHVWVFSDGRFTYEACCLREVYMEGYYRFAESGTDSAGEYLVLDLYDIEANEMLYEVDQQIRISMDKSADTIRISLSGPYTRLNP
jgi:hypothetical protein